MRKIVFVIAVVLGLMVPSSVEARPMHGHNRGHRPAVAVHVSNHHQPAHPPHHAVGCQCHGRWVWVNGHWTGDMCVRKWRPGYWQWVM